MDIQASVVIQSTENKTEDNGESEISESFPEVKLAVVSDKKDCTRCHGVGKVPIFLMETISEKCDKCNGTGWKIVPCKKCTGGFNSKGKVCEVCNGTAKFILRPTFKKEKKGVPCKSCNGSGNVNYNLPTKKVLRYETCSACGGRGKTKVVFGNPVISPFMAKRLKSILF